MAKDLMSTGIGTVSATVVGTVDANIVSQTVNVTADPVTVAEMAENVLSPGLTAATYNSLSYRVAEIERHLHNSEYWYGKSAVTGYFEEASMTPFSFTSGAIATYGAEVLLSDGNQINGGDANTFYDFNDMVVVALGGNNRSYEFQFWYGDGLFADATFLTEKMFHSNVANSSETAFNIMSRRIACNKKLWGRIRSTVAASTATCLFGLHIYEG